MAEQILPKAFCKKCQCETEHYKDNRCRPCTLLAGAAYRKEKSKEIKATQAAYRLRVKNSPNREVRAIKIDPVARKKARDKWRSKNQESVKANKLAYRLKNKEKIKAKNAAWAASNPESIRLYAQNRRAKKLQNGGRLSKGIAEKLFDLQRGKCACCAQPLGENYHLDHIMPIHLGGDNTDSNVQLLRQQCNQQKHAKHPIDFMQSRGFLL